MSLVQNQSPKFSAAASGWAGWALAHPEFGSSVNPITTRGADYAQRITSSPPGFENLAAALRIVRFSQLYGSLGAQKQYYLCFSKVPDNFDIYSVYAEISSLVYVKIII